MTDTILYCGGSCPLSTDYITSITINDVVYNCVNQYLMAEMAKLFHDTEMLGLIMAEYNPIKQRQYGRQIRGFDAARWDAIHLDRLYTANRHKFEQDRHALHYLLDTGEKQLVEASKWDRHIGIGFSVHDALKHRDSWGANMGGILLMKIRNNLRLLQ
jgi:ribA/ribD-fused uncharacterized protein